MKSNSKKSVNRSLKPAAPKEKKDFPIVGIGASAGGLEALELFLGNIPDDSGMAFVIIQHLDPKHAGIMPELLQRLTRMKVLQATDRLVVVPGCVYVIPPNRSMSILKGALYLFEPVETHGLRLPIDTFFRSLADDRQERSIGVILSGMGSDGSLGIKAIKEKNGVVLVQDPASAKFNGMPRSASEAVIADIIAPANELPARLINFLKFIPVTSIASEVENKNRSNLEKIIILLREKSGHDFSLYRKNTLFRRIERRKGIHQIDKISSYVRFLQDNPKEIEILFKELLIGVTGFFRDPNVWETLKKNVFPEILKKLPNNYNFRAWVPGCSTGEEAYTLAIVLREALEELGFHKNISIQIFATDLDFDAIEVARKGYYTANISADVSPERLNRFFVHDGDGYRVSAAIREMIIFAAQDVIKDPPFTKLDILTCRNLLIYLEPALQKKLLSLFYYSLNPGSILILGTSETIGTQNDCFVEIDAKLKIFKRTMSHLPVNQMHFPSSFYKPKTVPEEKKNFQGEFENIELSTDKIILQRFAPAGVLVNEKGDIVYITGKTGKYLELNAGKADLNIYTMLRDELRQALHGAFRKALLSFDPILVNNIQIATGKSVQYVSLTIQRIESPESIRGMVLILFNEQQAKPLPEKTARGVKKPGSNGRIKELELELQHGYEEIQSIREEMQTSQEELKSTNEELQSSNEELQSTNEELTTSKEELQSLNEELQTVNLELQSKVDDYERINNDLKNLLNSLDIAILFLDKEFNIRRFTKQSTRIFKLIESDIGRPFTDIVSEVEYDEIATDVREVLRNLVFVEKSVKSRDGRWFAVRIMPYRTFDDRIDGLVITFTEITLAKNLEAELNNVITELHRTKLET